MIVLFLKSKKCILRRNLALLSRNFITYHVSNREGSGEHKQAVDILDEPQLAIGQNHEVDKQVSQTGFEILHGGEDSLSSCWRGLSGFFKLEGYFVFVFSLLLCL